MKNVYFYLIGLLFVCYNSQAQATIDNSFYYYKEGKIFLKPSKEHIIVYLAPGESQDVFEALATSLDMSVVFTSADNMKNFLAERAGLQDNNAFFAQLKFNNENVSDAQYKLAIDKIKKQNAANFVAPCFTNENGKIIPLTKYFYVELKSTGDSKILKSYSADYEVKIEGTIKDMPKWYVLSSQSSSLNTMQVADKFYESGLFENAEPEKLQQMRANNNDPEIIAKNNNSAILVSNDSYYSDQWALHNTGQSGGTAGTDVKGEEAWSVTTGNSTVKIAVFDEGFETNHPDLATNNYGVGYDTYNGSSPSVVRGSHGTACAGIIAAVKDNSLGVAGIAPNCNITSISISFNYPYSSEAGLASGFNWAVNNNIWVISCSWGGGSQSSLIDAGITNALTNGRGGLGTVVVFSAGNSNILGTEYPAKSNPLILDVGAVDRCGRRSGRIDIIPESCDPWGPGSYPGSSYGLPLDIVAPGSSVSTTDRQGNNGYNSNSTPSDYANKDYTDTFGGTSSACPYVSGVVGLVLSVNPDLTVQEVNDIIEKSAQKISPQYYSYASGVSGRPNGTWNQFMGYGLVNAYKAVKLACPYSLTVTQSFASVPVDEKQASYGITASNTIVSGTTHTYHAGNAVVLTTGFVASIGSVFRGYIAGCASNITARTGNFTEDETAEEYSTDDTMALLSVKQSLKIYPNPANSLVTIDLTEGKLSHIVVVSIDGKTIIDKIVNSEQSTVLNVDGFTRGVYLITVETSEGTIFSEKLIKN